ncbi:unnamed protein product [Fraxinus pennsylvanica]|uniref:Uncharacterized protein n=1 Tax=Fraxinus pennsylvanica TaxID=56036 RepID=A0AAD1ZM40_9LAMI|nr:unnamed protein product [Fraxinus pennsylvanica]
MKSDEVVDPFPDLVLPSVTLSSSIDLPVKDSHFQPEPHTQALPYNIIPNSSNNTDYPAPESQTPNQSPPISQDSEKLGFLENELIQVNVSFIGKCHMAVEENLGSFGFGKNEPQWEWGVQEAEEVGEGEAGEVEEIGAQTSCENCKLLAHTCTAIAGPLEEFPESLLEMGNSLLEKLH